LPTEKQQKCDVFCRFLCILTATNSLVLANDRVYLGVPKKFLIDFAQILRVATEVRGGQPPPPSSRGFAPEASALKQRLHHSFHLISFSSQLN